MTYPEKFVTEIVERAVPIQVDNSRSENEALLNHYRHIWTPDIRILDGDGVQLAEWQGYLPPAEFAARALVAMAQGHLRLHQFEKAEPLYVETLKRFSTSLAAPEAQYYLGVTRYRANPEGSDLLHEWALLRAKYPLSEARVKQSFKEIP